MASVKPKPAKGILKPSSSGPIIPPRTSVPSDASRRTAVQHASILQQRKNAEAEILDHIITLIDLPLSPPADPNVNTKTTPPPTTTDNNTNNIGTSVKRTPRPSPTNYAASHPSTTDAETFTSLIRIFQPTDYDDLITERNICTEQRCGYTLCPSSRRKYSTANGTAGPMYKLINIGRRDFDIVERKELEKWCSPECARRAMYIKVQLNETAAWERWADDGVQIDLLPEDNDDDDEEEKEKEKSQGDKSKGNKTYLEQQQQEGARMTLEDKQALALERGDGPTTSATTRQVKLVIREKNVVGGAQAPSLADQDEDGLVEGYKSTFKPRKLHDGSIHVEEEKTDHSSTWKV